jgi:hypothetical protein
MSKSWVPTWAEYFILSDVSSNGVSISFYRDSDLMLLRDASQAFPIAQLPVMFAVGTPMVNETPLSDRMVAYVNEAIDGMQVGDAEAVTMVDCSSGIAPADMVNEPPHYKAGDIECIDAIRAALTDDEFRGYCKGNMIKYQWRERLKGGLESIKKAMWYGQQMIKHCKESV